MAESITINAQRRSRTARRIPPAEFLANMKAIVSVEISESQKVWLDGEARKEGISRSAFLRRLLPSDSDSEATDSSEKNISLAD